MWGFLDDYSYDLGVISIHSWSCLPSTRTVSPMSMAWLCPVFVVIESERVYHSYLDRPNICSARGRGPVAVCPAQGFLRLIARVLFLSTRTDTLLSHHVPVPSRECLFLELRVS